MSTTTTTADDTRTRVLHAAGSVFAEKGFQAATVREICQVAGVNLASVNYHFGDKQQLYHETVRAAHRLTAQQVPMPSWSDDVQPRDQLRGFIRTMLTRMLGAQSAPWQSRLMTREVLQPTAACKELVEENFRPHFQMLVEIIKRLAPVDTPPPQLHKMAFSVVGQCLFYRVAGEVVVLMVGEDESRSHHSIDQLAEHIAAFTLAALCGGEPGGTSL